MSVLIEALPERRVVGEPPARCRRSDRDSRRVEAGDCFVAVPGFKQDGAPLRPRRGGPRRPARGRPRASRWPACRWLRCWCPRPRALARAAGRRLLRPPVGRAHAGRDHRDQRQDDDVLPGRCAAARARPRHRHHRHDPVRRWVTRRARPIRRRRRRSSSRRCWPRCVPRGVGGVAMEVSSHALALPAWTGSQFDVAVFTNLTQDHLDFHGTLEEYRRAKRRLFELLAASPKPGGPPWSTPTIRPGRDGRGLDLPVLTFGLGAGATVRAVEHDLGARRHPHDGRDAARPADARSPLIGEHNVMNLLGAVATGLALGLAPAGHRAGARPRSARCRAASSRSRPASRSWWSSTTRTRRTRSSACWPPRARSRAGRLGVVFGCGGDRDRDQAPDHGRDRRALGRPGVGDLRQPALGATARRSSTRSSSACGGRPAPAERSATEPDRRRAIEAALGWAAAGDTVVIAGKGHETYQIIGAQTLRLRRP